MTRYLVVIWLAIAAGLGVTALFGGCDKENLDWGEHLPAAKEFRLEPSELTVVEGGDFVVYRAALGMVPDDSVIVVLEPALGQVVVDPDTLVFTPSAWELPVAVQVSALDDALAETTMVDTLRHVVETRDPEYAALTFPTVPITVHDDDNPGAEFSSRRLNVVETENGSDTDSYSVRLASEPRAPVAVRIQPLDTTIVVAPSRLVFSTADWNVPQEVTVAALEDRIAEGSHQGVVQHEVTSLDLAYDGLDIGLVVVEIEDTDVPLLALLSPEPMLREDLGPFVLTVDLNIPTVGTVAVQVALNDGLAVAGADYVDQQPLITIPPGEMSATVEVVLVDDPFAEPVENFFARLVEPAFNAQIGTHDLVELSILDDERPSVSIADAVGEELAGSLTFRITVDPPPLTELPVNVSTLAGTATAGLDFVPLDVVEIVVQPDSSGVDLRVTIVDDGVYDGPEEFFFVEISAIPTLANVIDAVGMGTILDPGKSDIGR